MKKWIAFTAFAMALFCLTVCSAESSVAAGDIVTFGHYEQDNDPDNGPEPIEWIVLDVQDGKALLISRYGLERKPYHTDETDYTDIILIFWNQCSLRIWLNSDFLSAAFSDEERSAILLTDVDNSGSQGYSEWDAYGGHNTQDWVFLLSYAEANRYFGVTPEDIDNMKSRVAPTAYVLANETIGNNFDLTADGEPARFWWLRSPGLFEDSAAYVDTNGALEFDSYTAICGVVRPALWIDLNADIF